MDSPLTGLGLDIRYALQLLRRQWGHALVIVLTMALGIGAATVLFGVAYGVLLKPLPWPDADRFVRLYETRQGSTRPATFMTNSTYLAWSEQPTTIDGLAAWSGSTMTMAGTGEPERVRVVEASPSLFSLLRAQPALGVLFRAYADGSLDETQTVLSYGFWQQRFGGRPDVIGQPIRFDGTQYRIVGVMSPSFAFPDRETRAWTPFRVPPVVGKDPKMRSLSMFNAIAKLRPGVSTAQAAAEGTARGRSAPDPGLVAVAVFGSKGPVQVSAVNFLDSLMGDLRPALVVFMVAVGLLLATATANVASLQLARATNRRREIAIRSALGAGGGALMRQLLVENTLVGLCGGLAGLLLAAWMLRALPSVLPADFPRLADVTFDWRVGAFAIGVSLVASIAFGLVPAVSALRVNLAEALAEDGLAPVGGGSRSPTVRARLLIMAGQIAVASVLLLGAALLSRSFVALIHADRGYEPAHLLTARLPLPDQSYSPQQREALLEQVLERLRTVPGVTQAAFSTRLPLTPGEILAAFPMPSRGGGGTISVHAAIRHVSPGYFGALGLRMIEGRPFTDADTLTSRPAVVVNRAFARQYLDTPAVGARIPASFNRNASEAEVIGVVADVEYGTVADPVSPEVYMSSRQLSDGFPYDEPILLVRTASDPTRFAPILRSIVREQDASAALESVMTMEDRLLTSLARPRLYAILLGGFAGFAVLIAGVGLFGVLTYSVLQRSREIGVRTSLGATPRDIVLLVLRQALTVTIAGLAVGLAASAALMRYISGLLYGVKSFDEVSFAVVPVLLAIVAALACVVPARRAAAVDPVRVLR
jgi:putative ABC transport system permease protein